MAKAEIFMNSDNQILTDRPDLITVTNIQTSADCRKWHQWKNGSIKRLPNGIQLLRKIGRMYVRPLWKTKVEGG